MFDLELAGLTEETGRAVEHAAADSGAWPVRFSPGREERRWFGVRKAYPSVLEILTADGQGHALVDPDHWDEDAWQFRVDAIPRLIRLVEILSAHAPTGFTFRATWAGSPIEHTIELTVSDLISLLADGRVNDHTRYRVLAVGTH